MNKIAYLECVSGIAGDMCLGALVDLGVPLDYIIEQLQKLGIGSEYRLSAKKVHRQGQQATKVSVDLIQESTRSHSHTHSDHTTHPPARHLPEIENLIKKAPLPDRVTAWSLAVFRQLAAAEGAVHGVPPTKIHFHEVGATDALVDIVGTCLGFDWLNVNQIYCSAMPTGGGTVKAAHGILPVPVPAVLKLWQMRQVPIYSNGIEKELVTPTGAAIATTLALSFGSPPAMQLEQVGLGAGTQELAIPNLLRIWLGESIPLQIPQDSVTILETQIDDLTPQAIAYLFDILLQAGAVDVFTQAITMKKSRLGTLLTVLCPPEKAHQCQNLIFRETTTLGIRHRQQQRSVLYREIQSVNTPYGEVRLKIAYQAPDKTKILTVQPEYEDCAALASKHHQPWRVIHQLALQSWQNQLRNC